MGNRKAKSTLVWTLRIRDLLRRHIGEEAVSNTVEAVVDGIPRRTVRNGLWRGNFGEINLVVRENIAVQVIHDK